MRLVIALFLLSHLIAPAARADMTFANDDLKIRFTKDPCQWEALADALKTVSTQPQFMAVVTFGNVEIPACWADAGERVWIVDYMGNSGIIPKADLKPSPGI